MTADVSPQDELEVTIEHTGSATGIVHTFPHQKACERKVSVESCALSVTS
jgi:hypothetical protein